MRSPLRPLLFGLALLGASSAIPAHAQDLVLEGEVADDAPPYFELPFEVPVGTVEVEVRHDDLSEENILDWGLRDPSGFRGWGGGNTEPAVVSAERASRSYLPGPIEAGEWAVLVGKALVSDPPATYRVELFFRTEVTLPAQPDRMPYEPPAPLTEGPRWLAGDFHVHSLESGDANATFDAIAALATERGLDFVELSEHNTVSQTDFLVAAQSRHPELLFMPGIEVTTYFGHANAMGATAPIAFDVRSGTDTSIETVTAAANEQGLFAINHPVLDIGDACLGCAWELDADPTAVHAVEVQNGAYSLTGALFYRDATNFWEALLDAGARTAAIGGSDDHRAGVDLSGFQSPIGSPTTMVYADELSVAAILEGVRAGRTVVKLEGPSDPMVELFAGDAMIGDTVTDREVELLGRVTGAATGATLRFLRNGELHEAFEVDADPFEARLTVNAPFGDVADRWRLELVNPRPRVVTSHLWVEATGEPPPPDAGADLDGGPGAGDGDDGCGCTAPGGERSWPVAWLAVALGVALWRRRC